MFFVDYILHLRKLIPAYTIMVGETDDIVYISSTGMERLGFELRPVYHGPIDECDILVGDVRVRLTEEQRKQVVIWRVLHS